MKCCKHLIVVAVVWLLSWGAGLVWAQDRIEVIALRYRSVEQMLPVLQPLIHANEAISGQGFNLIVRAGPETLKQIREMLQQVDRPIRQMLVQVRFGDLSDEQRNAAQAEVRIEVGQEVQARGRARLEDTHELRQQNQTQQIRVLEGGQAWIQSGSAIPYRTVQVITQPGRVSIISGQQWISVGTGFNVRPQLHGEKIWLEINPQQMRIESTRESARDGRSDWGSNRQSIVQQQASATIETRLGEWVELAATQNGAQHEQSGILARTRQTQQQEQSIWLKVDLIEH